MITVRCGHSFGVKTGILILAMLSCHEATYSQATSNSVSDWLTSLRSNDENIRVHAAYNLKNIASTRDKEKLLTTLIDALDDRNPHVVCYVAAALGELDLNPERTIPALMKVLAEGDPNARVHATVALSKVGSAAVPALMQALARNDMRFLDYHIGRGRREDNAFARLSDYATLALANMGSPAVPALVASLKSSPPETRSNVIEVLRQIGPDARDSVPSLVQMLKDEDSEIRVAAAKVLGYIGSDARMAVPALVEALKTPDLEVREHAAGALGQIGPEAKAAVPALILAMRKKGRAVGALGSIGPEARAAVPMLIQLLSSESDASESAVLARALAKIGPTAVPALIRLLEHDDSSVRASAASILGEIRPMARVAVPALIKRVEDKDEFVRSMAIDALAPFGPAAEDAIPALISALHIQNTYSFDYAVRTLGSIGPAAVPPLIQTLTADKDEATRVRSAAALGSVGPAAKAAVPLLIAALRSPNHMMRRNAAYALAEMGQEAKPAVPALIVALNDTDWQVRDFAVLALGAIGPEAARTAVPALIETLREARASRSDVVIALGEMGPAAKGAIPLLIEALEDRPDPEHDAATALAKIGPSAVPRLIRALRHRDDAIRRGAALALGRMGAKARSAAAALMAALNDNSSEVRLAAAEALLEIGVNPKSAGPMLLAVITDDVVYSHIGRALFQLIYQRAPFPLAGPGRELPGFPIPPPRFSAWEVLPRRFLGADNSKLTDVFARLTAALSALGYQENGLFELPDGFAVVTKLERISADGASFVGPDRWTRRKIPQESWSIREYMGRIFFEKPGHFRFIVFVVTSLNNLSGGESVSESGISELFGQGGRVLPDTIGNMSFRGRNCHVLIYHFEKRPGQLEIDYSGQPTAFEHLRKARIPGPPEWSLWDALVR